MDWFEKITGFKELGYEATQEKLWIEDGRLCSRESASQFEVGLLETPTLRELRDRARVLPAASGKSRLDCIVGDARELHSMPECRHALFQVASQFNLLEMVSPSVSPEQGVTRYAFDRTQGPACAIAAGAATIFRNYLIPLEGGPGQRADRQIDCLRYLGDALQGDGDPPWLMQNGYALCTERGLVAVDARLQAASKVELDRLRALLRVGLHWDVRVTDSPDPGQIVSQVFCSALPVAYSRVDRSKWRRFALLVLEAAYEATILAALLNVARGRSNRVLLTRLGGGAFGNDADLIDTAMLRALRLAANRALHVSVVCFGEVPADVRQLIASAGD